MLIAIVIVLTVLPIIVGALLGLTRGWRRAFLRLILVGVSLGLAFALCGVVAGAVLNINVSGGITLRQFIVNKLADALNGVDISSLAVAITESIAKVVTFALLFAVFLLLTWAVVFPICKIFVKPWKNNNGEVKKRRLVGMTIGAVQGVAVAFCFCVVFSGLFFQAGRLGNAAVELVELEQAVQPSKTESKSDAPNNPLQIFSDYANSSVGKFYDSLGGGMFKTLSRVTAADGRNITLPDTVDAIEGAARIAKEIAALRDFDIEAMFKNGEFDVDFEEFSEILGNLDSIKNSLSLEALETIQSALGSLSDGMNLPVDFGEIDLQGISFVEEGNVVKNLYSYTQNDTFTQQDAKDVVREITDSNIVLPLLQQSQMDIGSKLNEAQLNAVSETIDEMQSEGYDASKLDEIRKLFGLA